MANFFHKLHHSLFDIRYSIMVFLFLGDSPIFNLRQFGARNDISNAVGDISDIVVDIQGVVDDA